jgi:hypothetical protein
MTEKENQEISLHVAGATVRHSNPFENIEVFKNSVEIDQEFRDQFVIPYYMDIPIKLADKKGIEQFGQVKDDFTRDVVKKLLGDFNWRTRQTGAYFAAINDFREFEENIGQLLLESEVYYAGKIYALTLAKFNTKSGLAFLTKYLDHYLANLDLFFDQKEALTAVKYLDEINGTNNYDKYLVAWCNFIKNKQNWKMEITTDSLASDIEGIAEIKKHGH